MSAWSRARAALRETPRTWLVTGAAGFIGSHLLETLLRLDQTVVGLDNLSTGHPGNLRAVEQTVTPEQWQHFRFLQGSVAEMGACREATKGVDLVLHQAGFISVPLSVVDPLACHDTNVTGTLNLLLAARDHGIRRVVYASSSAVYGDCTEQPSREERVGLPLSPYGASKRMAEHYAAQMSLHHGMEPVGLRYFNVFGPRQNPHGGYAAVIPQWITATLRGEQCRVHGDGTQTRDFCPVQNVVQANLLAALAPAEHLRSPVYNVGLGGATSLLNLHRMIAGPETQPEHGPERPGDIQHSAAAIERIREDLGYNPEVSVEAGLQEALAWYRSGA